jgi:Ca-activated chloride channel family protein
MTIDFAVPQWFILSLLLPFLAGLKWWSRSRATISVNRIVAPRLQPQLVRRLPWWADWTGFGLQLLALLAFITALARPQWGFSQMETSTAERNVFIAIDTSRSMLAEDVQPNRLERAKLLAQDLVRTLPADRIGVIAFAGKAFIQAPLTVDHEAVLETLSQLDVEVIPRGGTNLTSPVLLALDSMRQAETSLAAMVIFSDGEDMEGQKDKDQLSRELQNARLLVVSVGAGTAAGGIIPDPEHAGQFLKDESGQIVRTRLNPAGLQELSELSGGSYVDMGSEGSVTAIVQQALRKLESQRLRAEDVRVPHERYAIPLAAGMILLLLSHLWPLLTGAAPARSRAVGSGTTVCLGGLLALFSLVPGARATSVDAGLDAYRSGKYKDSQELFTAAMVKQPLRLVKEHCEFGIGAAAYRDGDFETAREAFGQALLTSDRSLQAKAHYNLANCLFQTGRAQVPSDRKAATEQWQAALAHYDAARRLNPDEPGAKQNRDFVQKLLDDLNNQPPPPEPKKDPDQDKDKKDQDQKEPPPPKQPEKDPDQKKNPNPDPDKKDKPEDEPPTPDDPKQDPAKNPDAQEPKDDPNSPPAGGEPPPPRQWTPSQARQILEQNAGEDLKAKPVQIVPSSSSPFKNW